MFERSGDQYYLHVVLRNTSVGILIFVAVDLPPLHVKNEPQRDWQHVETASQEPQDSIVILI